MASSGLCPRCGEGQETLQHLFYECSANAGIEECRESEHLADEALVGLQERPAFWLRGLITLDMMPEKVVVED
eukprot:10581035-Lingulodinium_polyedra.AAC.1